MSSLKLLRQAVLGFIASTGLLIVSLSGCTLQPAIPLTPEVPSVRFTRASLGVGDWYIVYFTRPVYPESKQERTGGIDAALVEDIDLAQRSVAVAVFDIDLPSMIDALIRAKQRGVRVYVVTDYDANEDSEEFQQALERLARAEVPVRLDDRGAFMHNKFIILDDQIVWTGSTNLTGNDVYRNNNNMLRFAVPPITENYRRRFEHLFAGRTGNDAPHDTPNPRVSLSSGVILENYFSPDGGADKAIEARLRNARQKIRVLAFSFTSDDQADLLIAAHNAGLQVQGVFERRNAEGSGAEFPRLKRSQLDVWLDGNCYIQHHKVYIIDDRTVIFGSYNFTSNAETDNDENLLIVDDPTLAAFFNQEFDRIYAQAQNPSDCAG